MKTEDFIYLPQPVQNYLNYLSSIKGKSPLTVCEYASDLKLFFAYMLRQENLSKYKNTPIEEIDISKLDIDFISSARVTTAYAFWIIVELQEKTMLPQELERLFQLKDFTDFLEFKILSTKIRCKTLNRLK